MHHRTILGCILLQFSVIAILEDSEQGYLAGGKNARLGCRDILDVLWAEFLISHNIEHTILHIHAYRFWVPLLLPGIKYMIIDPDIGSGCF